MPSVNIINIYICIEKVANLCCTMELSWFSYCDFRKMIEIYLTLLASYMTIFQNSFCKLLKNKVNFLLKNIFENV